MEMEMVGTRYVSAIGSLIVSLFDLICISLDDFCRFKDYFVPIHQGRQLHVRSKQALKWTYLPFFTTMFWSTLLGWGKVDFIRTACLYIILPCNVLPKFQTIRLWAPTLNDFLSRAPKIMFSLKRRRFDIIPQDRLSWSPCGYCTLLWFREISSRRQRITAVGRRPNDVC